MAHYFAFYHVSKYVFEGIFVRTSIGKFDKNQHRLIKLSNLTDEIKLDSLVDTF